MCNICTLFLSKFFKLSNWLLIIARQPFSGLAIDFKIDLSQNCHSGKFTVFLVSNSSEHLALCFRLLSHWKVNSSPSVWWKADWTRFSYRTLPVLSSILFISKKSKHTHNMMQPPPCLKIGRVVLRDVLDLPQTKRFVLRTWS